MFAYLKQSTATQTKIIGPFVDDTDFKTAETGLTIANTDIKLSKNGATAVNKNSGGATHIANGSYAITLDATDTNTVGELFISVSVSGALIVNAKFYVLEEAVYDSMYGSSSAGPLQSTTAGRTLDVTATGAAGIDWGNVENQATSVDLSATAINLADTVTDLTNERGKYENGSVWIGPTANTNTVSYVDGITTNPVSTIAAAKTIADALNLRQFYTIRTGTSQIAADITGYSFDGTDWSLTTTGGSRDVGTSSFLNANVIGGTFAGTTGNILWDSCQFDTGVSVGPSTMRECLFDGTLTLNAAGDYDFKDCASGVAGSGAPTFALGTGDMTLGFRNWSGGINLTGINANDVITISGEMGTIDLGSATAGTVEVRGIYKAITNGSSGVTVNVDGAILAADVAAILVDTADMQPKLGTLTDLGGGSTVADNLSDMAGATFATGTDSLEAIRNRGDAAWTTGAGGSDRLLMVDTTIATLSSQTSFTLTAGSADNDAYNGCTIVIEDVSTSTQKAVGIIDDYTGSTKTVTLLYDPGVFTMAATDKVYVLAERGVKSTTRDDYHLDISSGGTAGIDWANVDNQSTAVDLSATDIQLCDTITTYTGNTVQTGDAFARLGAPAGADVSADIAAVKAETALIVADTNELQTDWANNGRLDLIIDAILVDTGTTVPNLIGTPAADLAADIAALPTAIENADALMIRNASNTEASAPEHSLCTVILANLEGSISGTAWTIKRTDGTTTHASKTLTTDAAADPVTGVT